MADLRVENHGKHVALITLNNEPRRNAMTRQMLFDMADLWDDLARSDHRCVIITGTGNKGFCAGADVSGDLTASPETAAKINKALLKTEVFPKPIIAAVNGDCVAGGVELMLASDIRVAAPQARFGLPEVRLSIYPFGGATVKLVHQIGYVHAMKLILGAELIDAEEARRIHLVNEIVNADQLINWALKMAETIATNSPSAVQAVKRKISTEIAEHALTQEDLDQKLGDAVRNGPHFEEGVAAFLEKRKPNYD
ncbi:MAG: enoyl-CoA hydratase/isomerase family protein [Pseudomonadota bacterium]|nr:enoyl-CoA hydratase/isomerase family protein [Pseudomonadota bacterium]